MVKKANNMKNVGDDRVKLLKDYTPTTHLSAWNTGNQLNHLARRICH